jgi:hypothetical protein
LQAVSRDYLTRQRFLSFCSIGFRFSGLRRSSADAQVIAHCST